MKGHIGILGWRLEVTTARDNGGLGRLGCRRRLRQWQRCGSVAAKARRHDVGLWRHRVRLTIFVAPWLNTDSSQYLILGTNPRIKARRARDKRKIKSKKFTTASIYVEFKSCLLEKKNQIL